MTSSTDFLVDDAYRKVWCSPGQDRQKIVAPTRKSARQGEIGGIAIGMRQYNLPSAREWYHVFTIGDLPPILVGMDTIVDKWVNVRAHCVNTSLLIDLYFDNGIRIPVHRAYFLYSRNGDLVLAIKATSQIGNLGVTQPFIRWRSNAYFDGNTGIPANAGIEIQGQTIESNDQLSLFQAQWRAARLKVGYATAFVNGLRVKDINITTVKLGDVVEYVRDASVKEVLELPVKDLRSFDSELDNKIKFLLPRAGLGTTIDYKDDIDLYLLNYKLTADYRGLWYHQNRDDSIRMVTHRDLSIPLSYLRGYVDNSPAWIWNDDLRVEVVIRHSGWVRPLVDEAHRIKELFKLAEPDRLNAMVGERALVSVWTASELENSPYVKLMGQESGDITRQMVTDAYGYNAISRLVGDTPAKLAVDNEGWVRLPYSLQQSSTVYEYDTFGTLIGWYIHDNSIQYPIRNPSTVYVEAYIGKGGVGLSTVYDQKLMTLDPRIDYRFYICDIWNGESRNNWRDVTGDTTYYKLTGNNVEWLLDFSKFHTAVKNDLDFLAHTLNLNYYDDLLAFTVNVTEVRAGRVPTTGVMDIPPGELDVFINGKGAIYGLDYYGTWPEYCIVNKAFLLPGSEQEITLRGRGFCDKDMQVSYPEDWGFVAYGMVSHNNRYNLRDDRVLRAVVGGALYTREELGFSEDGTTVRPTIKNGTPYQITHPIVPLLGVVDEDTYALRDLSIAIDQEVEDFLTLYLPEPEQPQLDPIPDWYPVFSPFSTKLIFDMLNGLLPMDEFKGEYSLEFVRERLAGYDWILPYDPALKDVDKRYVMIHPHPETAPIELNVYQYRLLDRALQVFLNNNVVIDRHLVIVEEGFEHDQRDHPHPYRTYDQVGA